MSPSRLMQQLRWWSFPILLLGGCRSPVPREVFPVSPAPPSPETPALRTAWSFRPSGVRLTYRLENHAQVTIRDDTSLRVDSVSSAAEAAFVSAGDGGRVSGQVLVYLVRVGDTPAAVPSGLALPLPFIATSSAREQAYRFLTPAAPPCSAIASGIAQSLRDLWFRGPDTLRIGTTWRDSVGYGNCRDGVPFTMTITRSFRVSEVDRHGGREQLTVVRTAVVSLHGEGAQSREAVLLKGTGESELTYSLDADTGEIVRADGTLVLDLTLLSKVRTQVVRQSGAVHVSRSP